MRIENITNENIKNLPDVELRNLRIRFIGIFDRYFADPAVKKAVDIGRQVFYNKYIILRAEMTMRGMKFFWSSSLDKDISNRIFKSSMWDLDVPAMGDVAIVPEYVSVGGSFIKSPKDAEDIDIIIRDGEESRDESFELKVGRLIGKQIKKEPHFVYAPRGPHSSYIPLFDLVLRAREETKKVKVKESAIIKKLTPAQRREYDEETERIKENKKKPEAKEPHEFRAAKFTHANWHPRCLICGDEEPIGKVCNMPSSWYSKYEWDDEEAWKEERKKLREKKVIKSSKEYYEQLDNWDDSYKRDNEEVVKSLVDGSVLDLGCGTGRLLKMLKDDGRNVVGIDNNNIALDYCKKRNIETKKLDLEKNNLPYVDGSFDNVLAVHSLEHLEKPKDVLKEAIRIARSKVIILSPLGSRLDPSHKHKFDSLNDFKKLFGNGWKFKEIEKNNTAMATLDKMELEKVAVRPMGPYVGPKPAMSGMTEAMSVDQIWGWAEKRLPLAVEEKLNSFRCFMEKLGDRVRIKTEGDKDRTKQFSEIADKLRKIPDDFILDCGVGIDRKGKPLPRIDLMTLMADEPELEEGDVIKATIFDIPYWKKDIHELPLKERREKLESFYNKYLKDDSHFALTNFNIVRDRKELEAKFKEMLKLPQSEGIVVKTLDSIWEPGGSTNEWAKLKRQPEIKVIVLARNTTKTPGTYNYKAGVLLGDTDYTNTIEFKGETYVDFGNTFNTKIKASEGQILTVGIGEIIPDEEKKRLQWLAPRVVDLDLDRKQPYFAQQIIDIASRYNILQKNIQRGIYLVEPHGEMAADGRKSLIVKIKKLPDDYVEKDVYLCSGDGVYGIIRISKPREITQNMFKELKPDHMISDKEAKEWGFDKKDKLSAYEFKIMEKFKTPRGYNYPAGVQTVIRDVKFQKVEEGGIDYKVGDMGKGILQLHIMGIEEDKIEALKKRSREAVRTRHNPLILKMLLKGAIGEQGAHIDLRMVKKGDDYFEGGEIMIGNLTGLDKLLKLEKGGKLRFGWKVPRKEEPTAETIRGPVSWMEVGKNKVEIFPPGEVGATTHKYGAMLILDWFDWEAIEPQDDHAKKFIFKGNKTIPEGTYLMAYVPVATGERVWMISKLKEEEEEEAKKQRQKLNSPTFAYKAVYGKLPKEFLTGRTDSPKKMWRGIEVDEHIKDEWLQQLNSIERIEVRATDQGKSKERVAFVVFRMSDPREDSEAEAVSEELDGMEGVYSLCDTGTEGRPRIVVAGKVIHGESGWEEWWNSLAKKIQEALESIRKLDLETFRSEGIDEDMRNAKSRSKQLFSDLRYLGTQGYPRIKEGKTWGEWRLSDVLKYYAKIVDTLRSIYFPIIPPKLGEKKFNTSYWQCYRDARKHMKTKPPKEEEAKEWDKKRQELMGKTRKSAMFKIMKIDKAKRIIGGVVYEPDEVDTQGDYTDKKEIEKAMYLFMKKYATDTKRIRVNHKGKRFFFPILEAFIPEEDTRKGNQIVKAGSWWIQIQITNEAIWKDVLENRLTGLSMGGTAKA